MALKYWFEFTDVKEIVHKVEISDVDFVGSSTQVYGSCSLEYSETKDTLESVRGSGLTIDLDANSDLTFSDLYSEDERTFSVTYVRGGVTLFNGWLLPEGLFESMVSDRWVISLDCTDGLGFLKNLSYVDDSTGLTFVGKQSLLEIIVNCLKRTKTPQNILTSINIYYDGLSQSLDIIANVYFNANRFIKDDDSTIMNCDEVLKSVLEPFGAVLTSYKGEWIIYKPNTLFDNSTCNFFAYTSEGVVIQTIFVKDFAFDLGSQVDGYYPHHANSNQRKTNKNSIGAYRINYKYGLAQSLIINPSFYSPDGTNIDDWDILSNTNMTVADAGESGVLFNAPTNPASRVLNLQTEIVGILEGSLLDVNIKLISSLPAAISGFSGDIKIQVISSNKILPDATASLYYSNGIAWGALNNEISIEPIFTGGEISLDYHINKKPQTGWVYVKLYSPLTYDAPVSFDVDLINFSVSAPELGQENLKGENHTFERTLNPSSKIEDVKTVFNGDKPSDRWIGTIYKTDEITPTSVWTRFGASEEKPILQIMGEERMKMYSKPIQVYSGDVYGYISYLSIVTINNVTGKFMPTTYRYDPLNNITSVTLTEVLNTDILSDITYKVNLDYGNVVEPTIIG